MISVTVFVFTKPLLPQADEFTDLKCVYSIYISWILNPFLSKQKNRKPKPAVSVIYFKSFYFVVIKPSGSTVNSGLSASVPSGLM